MLSYTGACKDVQRLQSLCLLCVKCYQLACKYAVSFNGRVHTIKSNIGCKEPVGCVKLNFRQSYNENQCTN